jgi:hypothetical protein
LRHILRHIRHVSHHIWPDHHIGHIVWRLIWLDHHVRVRRVHVGHVVERLIWLDHHIRAHVIARHVRAHIGCSIRHVRLLKLDVGAAKGQQEERG